MRRKDREVTDVNEILNIIERANCCHLGLSDGDTPYVVPLNYGYTYENGRLTLYFHGAKAGRKIDMLSKNPRVCFAITLGHGYITGEKAVDFSMAYECVMGSGRATIAETHEEKTIGLRELMRHVDPNGKHDTYDENVLNATAVIKLEVEEFSGKRNPIRK